MKIQVISRSLAPAMERPTSDASTGGSLVLANASMVPATEALAPNMAGLTPASEHFRSARPGVLPVCTE